MSVYTDMVPAELAVNIPIKGKSGVKKDNFEKITDIQVAVYKNDSFKTTQNEKYKQSTHNALTFCKDFEENKEYKLRIGTTEMEVVYFNLTGRYTTLLLKEIDFYDGPK